MTARLDIIFGIEFVDFLGIFLGFIKVIFGGQRLTFVCSSFRYYCGCWKEGPYSVVLNNNRILGSIYQKPT